MMGLTASLTLSLLFISLLLLSSFYPVASLASSDGNDHYLFGQTTNLSKNNGDSLEPRLISLGNKVYAVWSDFSYGENEILLSASKDGGITFSAPINLSNTAGSSFNPQIVAVGENVYVVWDDQTYGNDEVLFAASRDNGTTFKEVANISNSSVENSADPHIAAAGKYVYVVWTERNPATGHDGIMLRVSADEGRTFGNTVNLSSASSGNAMNPQIAAIENHFYVTWSSQHSAQDGTSEIFLRSSHDNGQSFGNIVNLSQTVGSESVDQRLAVSGDDLFVAWHDYNSTISDVIFKKVRNGGTSFDNTINLSNDSAENAAGSGSVQIAVSGNNVYVSWYELTMSGKNTLFFRASHDGGGSFEDKVMVEKDVGAAFPQQIAASGVDVYIVWQSNIGDNNNEVFFSESHDGGQNFQSSINLSNSAGESYFPQVATTANGSETYVVWIENATGSKDIMLRKEIASPTAGGGMQPTTQKPTKQIIITEVELSSANGTQWIEVYNPTDSEVSLTTMYVNSSDGKALGILGGLGGLPPQHYKLVKLQSTTNDNSAWSNINNTITIYPYDPNAKVEDVQVNPLWDRTPVLTDTFADSKTWQLNGTKWEFVQETPMRTIPEFPTAQLAIAISVAALIATFSLQRKLSGRKVG